MELAVGNLDYNGYIEEVIRKSLRHEPLSRIFTKITYSKEEIMIPKLGKYAQRFRVPPDYSDTVIIAYLDSADVLRANKHLVPAEGRFLIMTSYPLLECHGEGHQGRKPENPELRRIAERVFIYGAGIASNRAVFGIPAIDQLYEIKVVAHELGHMLGLKHGDGKHECIMHPGKYFPEFCNKCKTELEENFCDGDTVMSNIQT